MEKHTYSVIAQLNAAHIASGMHVRSILIGEPTVLTGKPDLNDLFKWFREKNTCKFLSVNIFLRNFVKFVQFIIL